jgi:hypothetical protein
MNGSHHLIRSLVGAVGHRIVADTGSNLGNVFVILFLIFALGSLQLMAPGCGARLRLVATGWWRQACGRFGCGRFVGNY